MKKRNGLSASESRLKEQKFECQPIYGDDEEFGLSSYKKKYKSDKKRKHTGLKITSAVIGVLILIILIIGGYVFFRLQNSSNKIFNGSLIDIIGKQDSLKVDEYGRSNFLIFGTSEDDPGHSGALLTDSIMVIGVNNKTGDANSISIPRDLWVEYGINGQSGKINEVYARALDNNNQDKDKAGEYFAKIVSEVIGVDIHYYASVNYSVILGVVDALGGVEVNIQSDDPRGIYDPATKLKLTNGIHFIDGKTALDLARARNSEGGYGLGRSNFDREKNQQIIVDAIRKKALNSGTLTDIKKVFNLMEALGNNVRTNIKSSETRSAVDLIQNINSDGIVSLSISEGDSKFVTTGSQDGQSIVLPIAGMYDFSQISGYITKVWSGS